MLNLKNSERNYLLIVTMLTIANFPPCWSPCHNVLDNEKVRWQRRALSNVKINIEGIDFQLTQAKLLLNQYLSILILWLLY